jgi:hypothetical protein
MPRVDFDKPRSVEAIADQLKDLRKQVEVRQEEVRSCDSLLNSARTKLANLLNQYANVLKELNIAAKANLDKSTLWQLEQQISPQQGEEPAKESAR